MLGIILGTSLRSMLAVTGYGDPLETPFGRTSSGIFQSDIFGSNVRFLSRHGTDGEIYAHKVNYRANVWALHNLGVRRILATATVGGINPGLRVGDIVIPDQVIDYTYGRDHTYIGEFSIQHYDFTNPFTDRLRQKLINTRPKGSGTTMCNAGTYGCTQGPRLETGAEILRMKQDGCDLVGMTLMPEAALARELDLEYAAICLVVNVAAGLAEREIDLHEADRVARSSFEVLKKHLRRATQFLD